MRTSTAIRLGLGSAPAALAAVLIASGCGSSSKAAPGRAATPATSAASSAAARPARLHLLSPRPGARTAQTLTVRVLLTGAAPTVPRAFLYRLDGERARRGGARLTFHELAPGAHRLVVTLAADRSVRASTSFTGPPPAPVANTQGAHTTTTFTQTRQPTPTTGMSQMHESPPRTTTTQTHESPPPPTRAPTSSSPPPASGGIPQNNGGDHDADNNGGPSDGDGNI